MQQAGAHRENSCRVPPSARQVEADHQRWFGCGRRASQTCYGFIDVIPVSLWPQRPMLGFKRRFQIRCPNPCAEPNKQQGRKQTRSSRPTSEAKDKAPWEHRQVPTEVNHTQGVRPSLWDLIP